MPNTKTTEKRVRQDKKRRRRNKSKKTRIKTIREQIRNAIEEGNSDQARSLLNELYGVCDRAAQKGAIHKNKASRIKSRMTQKVNEIDEPSE